jgi:hypothetical protein
MLPREHRHWRRCRVQVEVRPLQVGRKHHSTCQRVDAAGQTDANTFEQQIRMRFHSAFDSGSQFRSCLHGIFESRNHFLRQESSIHISNSNRGLTGPEIGHYDCASIVQSEIRGSSPAWQPAHSAIDYPVFLDQLFRDKRDGAPLQSGNSRQIGARDGLTPANQIQKHAAVNVPGNLARCYLGVGETNSCHGELASCSVPLNQGNAT